MEEHSAASFSVVDARNVVDEEVVRIDVDDDEASVLWCVENAAADEHDALMKSAVERMLLENFMVDCLLLGTSLGTHYEGNCG